MRLSLPLAPPGVAIPNPAVRATAPAVRTARSQWLPRRTRAVFVLAFLAVADTLAVLVLLMMLAAFAAPSIAHAPTLRSPMAASLQASPAQALAPLSER